MPPRKQPRDDLGRFKVKAAPRRRKPATLAASPIFNPFQMSVQQQGWLAGNGPGWWISDHLEELRHFVSWIFVGVHAVAKQWAQSKCNIYDENAEELYGGPGMAKMYRHRPDIIAVAKHLRRMRLKSVSEDTPSEQRTPIPDHYLAKKLDEPNPYTSGRIFRYQVACQIRLTGGCYIWEVPNQFDQPEHLWVIPRGWCRPMAPTPVFPEGGFTVTPVFNTFTQNIASPSLSTWNIPSEQMIQVGYPDPLYPGEFRSPLAACSRIIDIMEQTDTATWSSFNNAVKPSLLFSIDSKAGFQPTQAQIEQLLEQLKTFKAGANNFGSVLMAMLGVTVQQLMAAPTDLDFVQGREQLRTEVLAIQGVAPVVAGLPGATSYSEAAVQAKTTIGFSVAPDLDIYSDRLTKRWRKIPEWSGIRIEHEPEHFDDPTLDQAMIDKVAAAYQAGVMSANEYRAELKKPPLDDPIADIPQILLQPMLPPPGSPDPGVAGMGDETDPYSVFASAVPDTEDDLPSATGTGMKRPELQQASGNGKPKSFTLNGRH